MRDGLSLASQLAATSAELHAFDPGVKGHKKQIQQLRIAHGKFLVDFTMQALEAIPKDASSGPASVQTEQLLTSAVDAAKLLLWLGAFPSPNPEKLLLKVASRCIILRKHAMAAAMSALVVRSLHEGVAKKRGKAATIVPASTFVATVSSSGPWDLALPTGSDELESCEVALNALTTHLYALEQQQPDELGSTSGARTGSSAEMAKAIPVVLGWLQALVDLQLAAKASSSELAAGFKDSAKPSSTGSVIERTYCQLCSILSILGREGTSSDHLAATAWKAEAQRLTGRDPAPSAPASHAARAAPSAVLKGGGTVGGGTPSAATSVRRVAAADIDPAVHAEAKSYSAAAEQLAPYGVQPGGESRELSCTARLLRPCALHYMACSHLTKPSHLLIKCFQSS